MDSTSAATAAATALSLATINEWKSTLSKQLQKDFKIDASSAQHLVENFTSSLTTTQLIQASTASSYSPLMTTTNLPSSIYSQASGNAATASTPVLSTPTSLLTPMSGGVGGLNNNTNAANNTNKTISDMAAVASFLTSNPFVAAAAAALASGAGGGAGGGASGANSVPAGSTGGELKKSSSSHNLTSSSSSSSSSSSGILQQQQQPSSTSLFSSFLNCATQSRHTGAGSSSAGAIGTKIPKHQANSGEIRRTHEDPISDPVVVVLVFFLLMLLCTITILFECCSCLW